MTTPTARKEHICSVCGKPIQKGEKYFCLTLKQDGKLVTKKHHYTCKYENKPVTPKENKTLAKAGTVFVTEEQFKEKMKEDTKAMLETFSFQENMEICFVPLIITEIAWHYADKVVQQAIANRIPQTVKLTRTVKMLREEYLKSWEKDMTQKSIEQCKVQSQEFIKLCQYDLTILWYTLNQAIKSNWYELPYIDMRTDAYVSVVMCELLKRHNKRMVEIISERTGDTFDYTNPKTEALRECMEAYLSPAEIEITQHVNTSIEIMKKHLNRIEFNLT